MKTLCFSIPDWCDDVTIRRCTDDTWYAEVEGVDQSAPVGRKLIRANAYGDRPGDAVRAALQSAERPTEGLSHDH